LHARVGRFQFGLALLQLGAEAPLADVALILDGQLRGALGGLGLDDSGLGRRHAVAGFFELQFEVTRVEPGQHRPLGHDGVDLAGHLDDHARQLTADNQNLLRVQGAGGADRLDHRPAGDLGVGEERGGDTADGGLGEPVRQTGQPTADQDQDEK
jgi:hypothetical protein